MVDFVLFLDSITLNVRGSPLVTSLGAVLLAAVRGDHSHLR